MTVLRINKINKLYEEINHHRGLDFIDALIDKLQLEFEVSEEELLAFYKGKVESWQIPDRVIFVEELPIGSTGKVQKNKLREEYGKVLLAG